MLAAWLSLPFLLLLPLLGPSLGQAEPKYLEDILIHELRDNTLPIRQDLKSLVEGSSAIGVAVLEPTGVSCGNTPNASCEMTNPFDLTDVDCRSIFGATSEPSGNRGHGTKVAVLVAGRGQADTFEVIEGVAPNTTIYPFQFNGLGAAPGQDTGLVDAIDCAVKLNATGTQRVHVINVSSGFPHDTALENAVCSAICNDVLIVAAAGNFGCEASEVHRYPGAYDDTIPVTGGCLQDPCATGTKFVGQSISARDGILQVGGLDTLGGLGGSNWCGATPQPNEILQYRSQTGDVYAPGWGVPTNEVFAAGAAEPNPPSNYGTSFATPLVSGCAAALAAVDSGRSADPLNFWNAVAAERSLRGHVDFTSGSPAPVANMNCLDVIFPVFPTLDALSLTSGDVNANHVVTITGTGFDANYTVMLGSTAITPSSTSPTSFTVTVSSPTAGPNAFQLTRQDGAQSNLRNFTFNNVVAQVPTIIAVFPAQGEVNTPITVTVQGTNFVFSPGFKVAFGNDEYSGTAIANPISSTSFTVEVTSSVVGPVDVVVTNPDQSTNAVPATFTFIGGVSSPNPPILLELDSDFAPIDDPNSSIALGSPSAMAGAGLTLVVAVAIDPIDRGF